MDLNLKKDRNVRRKPSMDVSTQVFGKVPPQSKDMEEAVLGAIMLEKGAFDTVVEILKSDCFYVDANQKIFDAMIRLAGKSMPVDILTVVEELRFMGELDAVGGPFYVTRLTNAVVSSANVEAHARIILQKFIQRELIRISGEILSESYEDTADVFDLLDSAESKLFEITNNHLRKNYDSIDRVLVNTMKRIEDLRNRGDDISGVPSGFPSLDKVTYGWQPTDLIIIAARPAVGKTAFALNLARNAALHPKHAKGAAVFSLEMSSSQLVARILSAESEIKLEKISRGKLEEYEMKKLMTHGVERLAKAPIFVDDTPALNIFELRAKCRRLVHNSGVGIIIIDYLQLMSGSADGKNTNREQEISKISRDLKGLAKELQVPVIALSQLSRDVEKRKDGNKMPQLSDLRESGAIEQDADMVLFLYRPEYYDINQNEMGESNKGETHVRIAKHRNGQLDTIKLRAVLEYQRFEDDGSLENPGGGAGFQGGGGGGNNFAGMRGGAGGGNDEAKLYIQKGSKMNDMDFGDEGLEDAPF